jgi:hypothetical protein
MSSQFADDLWAVDFSDATFSGSTVNFLGARFSDGTVDFGYATFSGGAVIFVGATFSGGTALSARRSPEPCSRGARSRPLRVPKACGFSKYTARDAVES